MHHSLVSTNAVSTWAEKNLIDVYYQNRNVLICSSKIPAKVFVYFLPQLSPASLNKVVCIFVLKICLFSKSHKM